MSIAYDNIAAGSVAGRERHIAGGGTSESATIVGGNFAGGAVDPTTDTPYENQTVAAEPPNPEIV